MIFVCRGAAVDADGSVRFVHDLKLQCGNAFPASVSYSNSPRFADLFFNSRCRKSMFWILCDNCSARYSSCSAPKDGAFDQAAFFVSQPVKLLVATCLLMLSPSQAI
jgi:hypothetical protein